MTVTTSAATKGHRGLFRALMPMIVAGLATSIISLPAASTQKAEFSQAEPEPWEVLAGVPRSRLPDYGVDEKYRPTGLIIDVKREIGVEDRIKAGDRPMKEVKRAIAVQKSGAELPARLTRVVDAFGDAPANQKIYARWLGFPKPIWSVSRLLWAMTAFVVLVLASVAWWRSRTMGRLNRELRLTAAEREHARRVRRDSEEHLRNLAANVPGVVYQRVLTKDGTTTYPFVSHGVVEIFGFTDEEIQSDPSLFQASVATEDRESYETSVAASVATLSSWRWEGRIIAKDGQVKWVQSSAEPRRLDDGAILWDGLILDVTERKEAERARYESERRFLDVAEVGWDWIWETDPDLRYTWLSPRVEEILGIPVSGFIGRTPGDLGILPVDRESARAQAEDLHARRLFREFKFARSLPDGRTIHVSISGKPLFDDEGKFAGYRGTGRDITGEVEARESARRIEDRFLKAIESVPDQIVLFDEDERFVLANKAFMDGLGRGAKETKPGTTFEQLLRTRIKFGRIPDTATGRETEWFEERLGRFRDPSKPIEACSMGRWHQIRHVVVPGSGTFVIVSDITTLKQGEAELRASQARFRDFAEAASDVIWEIDAELRFSYLSDRFFELTGWPPDEVLGMRLVEYVPDRPAAGWEEHLETLYRREPFRDFVFARERADGKLRWFSSSAVPVFEPDGVFAGYRGSLNDITAVVEAEQALRESESRYRALVQASPEAIHVYCDNEVVFANPAFVRMMGGRSEKDVLGIDVMARLHPNDREVIAQRRERTLTSANALPPVQFRMRTLDDRTIHCETVSAPFQWRGKPAYIVLDRDITEERQREVALRQAQKMEAIGQLTGGVAHDFNNLMSVILGNLELLQEALDPSSALIGMVTPAIRAANRGGALTHRLLAFARSQALEPTSTDLRELVSGMIELMRRTLGETVEVEVVNGDALWDCEVDSSQLEAAILNLALNARDAMPAGGNLTIETRNVSVDEPIGETGFTPGNYVMLSVTDTGVGMPRAVADRAFDPFFSTKEVGKGSGLGLSMVYGFVKQSGGHVDLQSVEGKGTCVRMFFPREPIGGQAVAVASDDLAHGPANGETVLVVEDDVDVRALTVALLRDIGYAVVEAPDAAEALSLMDSPTQVDLLLSDVVLPGGTTGPELALEAWRRRPDVKIIFMSGYADDVLPGGDEMVDGIALLRKPFPKAVLARTLHAVLHQVDAKVNAAP